MLTLSTYSFQIPALKERLHDKERQLAELANNASNSNIAMTSSWHQAMSETKRQYEAIDGALEVTLFFKHMISFLLTKDSLSLSSSRRHFTVFKASWKIARSSRRCNETSRRQTLTQSLRCQSVPLSSPMATWCRTIWTPTRRWTMRMATLRLSIQPLKASSS